MNTPQNMHRINEYHEYTRSYDKRYVAEIRHVGLKTYRILKDLNHEILNNKVIVQLHKWDEQWERITNKSKSKAEKELNLQEAEDRTKEAQDALQQIQNLLIHTLSLNDAIDWSSLKSEKKFDVPNPKDSLSEELKKIKMPHPPEVKPIPTEPKHESYLPSLSIFDKIFKSLGQKKIAIANQKYDSVLNDWQKNVQEAHQINNNLQKDYTLHCEQIENKKNDLNEKFDQLEQNWKQDEINFYSSQVKYNLKIDELKDLYFKGDAEAVSEYCELVLNNSLYPDYFPKDFNLEYNPKNKILLVDYILPAPDLFPQIIEVKYYASKNELKEVLQSETQATKTYDTAIYNVTLRTIHELFEADVTNVIESIVFNGWVEAINKGTGKQVNNCIVSIHARKSEFLEIELSNVEPKACFKSLKGIGSSKLIGITAIQPVLKLNTNDKRFVAAYDVANSIDQGYNLATMDWEDFEHLLREIFEKEFSFNGGQVKVTQASRDGGVDAVAFDPDPIRGGKIVIQAKRYTNVVGVSAVRDLYGTVMNEGANKGILVTTADYGSDAYEFVKNKPLTLMNGSNLLYLLEKHGHNARIDLAEAKKLQS